MPLSGVQAFPRASQGMRPALTIEAIQDVRRGAEIRLPDRRSGGILPRVTRPLHVDFIGSCDPTAGSGSGGERTGDLPHDESRDRPVVVLHALEIDAQPDAAATEAVPGVPLDTLVAVRDAQDATGWAAEVPSATSEDVSEEALQGVGGVRGGAS